MLSVMNIFSFNRVFVIITIIITTAVAFTKRRISHEVVSHEVVSHGVVSPEQFNKLLISRNWMSCNWMSCNWMSCNWMSCNCMSCKWMILIGSTKAGINNDSFPAIKKIVEQIKQKDVTQVVNYGDGLYVYKSLVDVTILFHRAGLQILTAQSGAGKAESGTSWWPMYALFACFLSPVKNSDGTTTWRGLSDKGEMCAPLAFLVGIISRMSEKPIVLCVGGERETIIDESIYRKAGCRTYIFKTMNLTTPGKSVVEPSENYHVKCIHTAMNGQFYHPRDSCLFGCNCRNFS